MTRTEGFREYLMNLEEVLSAVPISHLKINLSPFSFSFYSVINRFKK